MTFRDNADDNNRGDTLENDFGFRNTEFRGRQPRDGAAALVPECRRSALAKMAAVCLVADAHRDGGPISKFDGSATLATIREWHHQTQLVADRPGRADGRGLGSRDPRPRPASTANVKPDIQLQVKFYLLHQIIATLICLRNGERLLAGCLPGRTPRPVRNRSSPTSPRHHRRDPAGVRKHLPDMLAWLEKHPLLYVPFENSGEPSPILEAQAMQAIVRFFLRESFRGSVSSARPDHVLHTRLPDGAEVASRGQAITAGHRRSSTSPCGIALRRRSSRSTPGRPTSRPAMRPNSRRARSTT